MAWMRSPSFLTKVGDSGDTGGQHSITVQYDSSLEDGQYYIYMFDNDFGYAMTRPDFDWTMIDGISTAQSSKDENSNSQFRKYLVDENADLHRSAGLRCAVFAVMSPPHRNCPMT